jgi:hypothetical protein
VLCIEAGCGAFVTTRRVQSCFRAARNASKGTVSEVENLMAISNFWALTARSLIGKSWKIVDIARLWPGLSRRRRNQPRTRLRCFRSTTVAPEV